MNLIELKEREENSKNRLEIGSFAFEIRNRKTSKKAYESQHNGKSEVIHQKGIRRKKEEAQL